MLSRPCFPVNAFLAVLSSPYLSVHAIQSMLSSPSYLEKMTSAVRESAQLPSKRVEQRPILGQIPYTGPRSPDASVE